MSSIVERVSSISTVESTVDIALPRSIKIELAAICNHKCVYCSVPINFPKKKFIDWQTFTAATDQAAKYSIKELGLFHMGEGTLHPRFNDCVDYVVDNYPKIGVFLTTNGTKIDAIKYCISKNIKSIKFSLNGFDQQSHLQATGVDDFDFVINNLTAAVQYRNAIKSTTEISASSIFANQAQQDIFAQKVAKIADAYYQTEIYNHAGQVNVKFVNLDHRPTIIEGLCKKPCFGLYNLVHIKVDGSINLCRFGNDQRFVVGNILRDDLKSVWTGDLANKIRQDHLNDKNLICNKCLQLNSGES